MKFIVELLAYGKDGEVREVALANPMGPIDFLLGQIFEVGQNEVMPQDHPSVSVGDVIQLDSGDKYLVLPIGFKKLSPTDYERYKAIPQNQRAVGLYLANSISKL